jgi:hypothetical protein
MTKGQPTGVGKSPLRVRYPAGQRLHCRSCGAEVEIVNPCPCKPPDLVLRCCGQEMRPMTGADVHVGDE